MHNIKMIEPPESGQFSFIVHSHLRWDFVWQRPQQILSRLATNHPVLFVEEPIFGNFATIGLEISNPHPNVIRVVPHIDDVYAGAYDQATEMVRDFLLEELKTNSTLADLFKNPVLWFYTPMPAPIMLGEFDEVSVVYDCMDELAQFKDAPADIRNREQFLLKHADVVFTGGQKLYESKARVHSNVHFFGCGVDIKHFGKARLAKTAIADDLKKIPSPIAGYFGVIDERLDYGLIAHLAKAKPEWTFVMVGPVIKIDPVSLPRAPNLKWLGQRDYKELPHYLKAYDVCLMPFALNEATQYINPTKTLEYMAANKPILSTAVADVVKNFTPIVQVAYTQEEFVQKLEVARELDEETLRAGLLMASGASWESIVENIQRLVGAAAFIRPAKIPVSDPLNAPGTVQLAPTQLRVKRGRI